MLFLGFCVTVSRIENTGFLTVFAEVLLATIAVLAIFLQVAAATTAAGVDILFDYHNHSLVEAFSLNHHPNSF